ncbi:MAG: toxin-antitoxin system YwqK family antitoxin [Fluviicola sp.]
MKRNENGSLEFEIHFINGIKDGAFIHYHKNGNISQKGTLINGKLNGDIYFYKENGKLFQVDYYEDNQLVRIEKK